MTEISNIHENAILKFERFMKSLDEINCELPDIQRIINEDSVQEIQDFQNNLYFNIGHYMLSGSIIIAINENTQNEYLIDGQHRLKAYKNLRNLYPEREMLISVEYIYYKENMEMESTEKLNNIYKIVNTCNPNQITKLSIDIYKYISCIEKFFQSNFKEYIKSSNKPQRPNINISKFKEYLVDNLIIDKLQNHKIKDIEFCHKIIELNRTYDNIATLNNSQYKKWHVSDYLKILDKIKKYSNKCYLGMYQNFEWVDRIIESLIYKKEFHELEHYSSTYRPFIPIGLRTAVWNSNTLTDNCYCCLKEIFFSDFECGHIIPVSVGGKTEINNLKKICHQCNKDMGTINLEEYKSLLSF